MKSGIHPKYIPVAVTCACGNVIETRSTKPAIGVEICSNCHPFFTGKQKIVDSAGRVERFTAKYRNVKPVEKKPAPAPVAARQPIPKVKPVVPLAVPKTPERPGRGPRPGGPGRPGARARETAGPGGTARATGEAGASSKPGAGPREAGRPRPGGPKPGGTAAAATKGETRAAPARGAAKSGPAGGAGAAGEPVTPEAAPPKA